jgi:hypothetical protein
MRRCIRIPLLTVLFFAEPGYRPSVEEEDLSGGGTVVVSVTGEVSIRVAG